MLTDDEWFNAFCGADLATSCGTPLGIVVPPSSVEAKLHLRSQQGIKHSGDLFVGCGTSQLTQVTNLETYRSMELLFSKSRPGDEANL